MIRAYHRPETLEEALMLIGRDEPRTFPLGGGMVLTQPDPEPIEVVDLQALKMNAIRAGGNTLDIGATVTLQELLESRQPGDSMAETIRREAPLNIRSMATVAGTIVACDGRAPFVNALLALDARVNYEEATGAGTGRRSNVTGLGDLLPLRATFLRGKLITSITVPINTKFAYHAVSRTPADKPIVSAALAQWPSGRTRLVIGGFGASPALAMDGTESEGVETAARSACHEADDEWASAGYRMEVAATLTRRCLDTLGRSREDEPH